MHNQMQELQYVKLFLVDNQATQKVLVGAPAQA